MSKKDLFLLSCRKPQALAIIYQDRAEADNGFDSLSQHAIEEKKVFDCSIFKVEADEIRSEKTVQDPTKVE